MPNAFPRDLVLILVKPVCTIPDDGNVENGQAVDGGVIADVRPVAAQENRVAQNRYQDGEEHLDTRAVNRIEKLFQLHNEIDILKRVSEGIRGLAGVLRKDTKDSGNGCKWRTRN